MENGTIDHIFKTYLVRGDEEATVQNGLEKATLILKTIRHTKMFEADFLTFWKNAFK